jgi:hypothetical protein
MPSDWDAGHVHATFYWTATGGTGTVKWYIEGTSFGDSDAIDTAWGTATGCVDTTITASDLHISPESGALTIAGAAASELVQIRVRRDPIQDTQARDALLLGTMISFTRA